MLFGLYRIDGAPTNARCKSLPARIVIGSNMAELVDAQEPQSDRFVIYAACYTNTSIMRKEIPE